MDMLLDKKIRELVGAGVHVYFQPPENFRLSYDCLIYRLTGPWKIVYADNKTYALKKRYSLTYICRSPTSEIPEKLVTELNCQFDRSYTSNNLYHYTFNLYF